MHALILRMLEQNILSDWDAIHIDGPAIRSLFRRNYGPVLNHYPPSCRQPTHVRRKRQCRPSGSTDTCRKRYLVGNEKLRSMTGTFLALPATIFVSASERFLVHPTAAAGGSFNTLSELSRQSPLIARNLCTSSKS